MRDTELFKQELVRLNEAYGLEVFAKDKKWAILWKVAQAIYAILTFGKVRDINTRFTTTIGKYVFFTNGWNIENVDKQDYVTLLHEGDGHVKQCHNLGLGDAWRGLPLFLFLYAFVLFPVGLAWFRYKFEREAYVISYYAAKQVGLNHSIDYVVDSLTGPAYLWTWPFKKHVKAYLDKHCK